MSSSDTPALSAPAETELLDLPDALLGNIFAKLQGDGRSRRAFFHSCQTLHQSDQCRLQLKSTTLFLDEQHHGSLASQLAASPSFTYGYLTRVVLQGTSCADGVRSNQPSLPFPAFPALLHAFPRPNKLITTLIIGDLGGWRDLGPGGGVMGALHEVFPSLMHLEVYVEDMRRTNSAEEYLYAQLPLLLNLKSLHIHGAPNISGLVRWVFSKQGKHVARCLSLESLSIGVTLFGGHDVSHLSSLVNLGSLNLTDDSKEGFRGLGVLLASLTALHELKIPGIGYGWHRQVVRVREPWPPRPLLLTSLTLEFVNCRQLPNPLFLPALQKLHIGTLVLEWDGGDGASERSACAALQHMCGVPSFSCNALHVREGWQRTVGWRSVDRRSSSSCSRLLQALADGCTAPRCLPTLRWLDVSLTDFLPCELSQLTQLLPSEKACVRFCDSYTDYAPLKCTLVEAVRIFSAVSELLVCPASLSNKIFSQLDPLDFASFTGTLFTAAATAWHMERSKEHLLIRVALHTSVVYEGTNRAYQKLAQAWQHFAAGMFQFDNDKNEQVKIPAKVDLLVNGCEYDCNEHIHADEFGDDGDGPGDDDGGGDDDGDDENNDD
eukprot:CAMPEP_0202402208 /NCGR_PEP_ID=MMETSP1128-20130828/4068_1 /ASSEMBLY_ACC=CAM_ASM_000463 /TAXON_ID=3047 /ORGANISM="Dunaliella tertiolecta, Strain CCMP1320" /LENGTH=605 /DNA_ID=CAMNT_0049006203 /DNA_START=164 /DNA_END=1981 /DNA_ORIENTATION=-